MIVARFKIEYLLVYCYNMTHSDTRCPEKFCCMLLFVAGTMHKQCTCMCVLIKEMYQ